MSGIKPMAGVPFRQQPYPYRVQEYVKIVTAFVLVGGMPLEWIIKHDTNLQTETRGMVDEVRRLVTAQVYPNPVEVVGHGVDGTERVIIDSSRLMPSGSEDPFWLARYLTSGNDAGAAEYSADCGGWAFVRDTVTGKTLARYMDGLPLSDEDYAAREKARLPK